MTARAQILKFSPAYDEQVRRLTAAAGVDEQVHRRVHDIPEGPQAAAHADVAVMNQVVLLPGL